MIVRQTEKTNPHDANKSAVTIGIIAQICQIFNASPSIGPYATATNLTANPILSTLALATSVPPVLTTSSSVSQISGTQSASATTATMSNTATSAGTTASATTTNVAQRIDLSRSAVQGAALALLGLAFYL